MCDLSDQETSTVYNVTRIKKARTPHRCSVCLRTIQPGEGYERHASLFDGRWDDANACDGCAADIKVFAAEHRFTPFPDGFEEFVSECVRGDYADDKRWDAMLERIAARRLSGSERGVGASTPRPELPSSS